MNGWGRLSVVVAVVAFVALPTTVAMGSEAVSPFVGAWESADPDGSHVRMQIGGSGRWQLRDDGGTVCVNAGLGFIAATASGVGTADADVFAFGPADIYCYPRGGREFVVTVDAGWAEYRPDGDVLVDRAGVCWWRSGVGSSASCPAP